MRNLGDSPGGGMYSSAQASAAYLASVQPSINQAIAQAAAAATAANQAQAYAAQAFQALATWKANGLLGSLTPKQAGYLGTKFPVNVHAIPLQGYTLPTENTAAMQAGIKAGANQLTLQLQAGQISQSDYNAAIAALTPSS